MTFVFLVILYADVTLSAQPNTVNAQKAANIYDKAIETIALSQDKDAVHAASDTLRKGGLKAINSLRKHLNDGRVSKSNHLMRTVIGMPDMGDHCFWLIQDIIEPAVPKLYSSMYASLSRDNITKWLDDRSEATLVELQIAAASQSLEKAKTDFEGNAKPYAKQAITIYSNRLNKLKAQAKKKRDSKTN